MPRRHSWITLVALSAACGVGQIRRRDHRARANRLVITYDIARGERPIVEVPMTPRRRGRASTAQPRLDRQRRRPAPAARAARARRRCASGDPRRRASPHLRRPAARRRPGSNHPGHRRVAQHGTFRRQRRRPARQAHHADYRVSGGFVPNDPMYKSSQSNLPAIRWPEAVDYLAGKGRKPGKEVVVAVTDTGGPDWLGGQWAAPDLRSTCFVPGYNRHHGRGGRLTGDSRRQCTVAPTTGTARTSPAPSRQSTDNTRVWPASPSRRASWKPRSSITPLSVGTPGS